MAERLSRHDIEERIQLAEESISGRVGSLEQVVRPRLFGVVERGVSMPSMKMVSMVVAGALVGLVAVSVGRRFIRRRKTADRIVDDVMNEVSRETERGDDDRTALRRALKRELGNAPRSRTEGSAGLVSFLLGYAVRTGVQTLVGSAMDRWSRNGSSSRSTPES